MKRIGYLFIYIAMFSCSKEAIDHSDYIDPTGIYDLESETWQKGDDTYGYTGQIQVKVETANTIVMVFGINKGAPSYNSGSFVDTLDYRDNRSVYRADPAIDPSCRISFIFTEEKITVEQKADDNNVACGFGHGVVAEGIFTKLISEEPVLKHPMTGEKIEE